MIMKKILLMAAFAVATLTANAQVWVGGSLGFNSVTPKDGDAATTISFAPTVGYNLSDNLAIAIELGVVSENKFATGNGASKFGMTVAPFARYTFFKSGIASLFIDGGFGLNTYKYDISGSDSQTGWHVGVRPGLAISLSEKCSIVATMGYLGYQKGNKANGEYNRFALNANGNGLNFGFYYTF